MATDYQHQPAGPQHFPAPAPPTYAQPEPQKQAWSRKLEKEDTWARPKQAAKKTWHQADGMALYWCKSCGEKAYIGASMCVNNQCCFFQDCCCTFVLLCWFRALCGIEACKYGS
jgi:hypothetical protein